MKATISNIVCLGCGWGMYNCSYESTGLGPLRCQNKECENYNIQFKRPIFELEKWDER